MSGTNKGCRVASKGEQCASKPGQVCGQRRTLLAPWAGVALVRSVLRGHAGGDEKHYRQISRRLGAPLIREVLGAFRRDEVSAVAAAERLGLGRTRFYELYAGYLRAAARHQEDRWTPGSSGGDHAPDWPTGVGPLLRRLLSARPPAPYRFAASEVHRRLGIRIDPATVRRWAMAHQLAHPLPLPRPPASARRWQCLKIGALWQLDATPHRWFPGDTKNYPLLDLLDDCSRVAPVPPSTTPRTSWPTSTSSPPPSPSTACRWNSMSTATACSFPSAPMR